jgi:DNA-binding LacI/PurR family transcriptional regulator
MTDKPSFPNVTMRDIAHAAGVAQSTVSRALRNDPRISVDVRRRVTAKAREMGYRPNPFVSAFTSQVRTHRRSPVQPNITLLDCFPADSPLYYEQDARDRAASQGYGTETIRLSDLDGSIPALNRILRARGVIGLLVLPVPDGMDLTGIEYGHLAAATVDPSLRKPDLHRATPDYFQSMELALTTLADRGFTRIGFCTDANELIRIGYRWLGSFYRWQISSGFKMKPYFDSDWSKDTFLEYVAREKPDALVSNAGLYARWAQEEGYSIPGDLAFASLNVPSGETAIAGVNQNGPLVGAAAVDLIISQIYRNEYGLPEHPKSVSIRSHWQEGDTVPARKAPSQT